MHADLSSGARIDIGSMPDQRRESSAKRVMKTTQTRNLIERLHHLLERKSKPDAFSGPLGNLLDDIQNLGVILTDVIFYRARLMPASFFTHVSELMYPPKQITPKGRLNEEGSPLLYAAYSPVAALVEVSAKVGQIVAIAAIEELPGHADLVQFFSMGMPSSSRYSTPTRDRRDKLVHSYLNGEIAKAVDEGNEHQYNSTIAIAENFLYRPVLQPRYGIQLTPGLIYPSVKAGQPFDENSYNVAMKPEVFDAHYHIVSVQAYYCLSLNEIHPINRATVSSDGSLQWEDKT